MPRPKALHYYLILLDYLEISFQKNSINTYNNKSENKFSNFTIWIFRNYPSSQFLQN